MINTLTASHVASMIDTMGDAIGGNGGYSMDAIWHTTYVCHMIFRGYNTHKIHYIEVYGVSTPSHVCLYTLPI